MSFQWPKSSLSSDLSRAAIRQTILEQIHAASSGHPGGSLSLVELLSVIFESHFEQKVDQPTWSERDRFVLSKGHGVPALYSVMSAMGFFDASELKNFRKLGHFLQGHPDHLRYPLMEASTGSLGQGVSVALGLALALRIDFEAGKLSRLPRVYCVIGDGEAQEGQVWECLMSCGKFLPGNLCFILDANKGQIDGTVDEVMSLDPIGDKIKSFNLEFDSVDGHDCDALNNYFASWNVKPKAKARFLLANTFKGKGVSFMEGNIGWHGKAPSKEELAQACKEIYEAVGQSDLPNGSVLEA